MRIYSYKPHWDYEKVKSRLLSNIYQQDMETSMYVGALKQAVEKQMPVKVKRFDNYKNEWWTGRCPCCNAIVRYHYTEKSKISLPDKQEYCIECGQLLDFK